MIITRKEIERIFEIRYTPSGLSGLFRILKLDEHGNHFTNDLLLKEWIERKIKASKCQYRKQLHLFRYKKFALFMRSGKFNNRNILKPQRKLSRDQSLKQRFFSEYNSYKGMVSRCKKKNRRNENYKYWAGKGIGVCDRWIKSFESFIEDMGLKPNRDYSIDRIDGNGNYEPNNCRWATRSQQMLNRTKS
jgi:hypothetical protein